MITLQQAQSIAMDTLKRFEDDWENYKAIEASQLLPDQQNVTVRFYCNCCGDHQEVEIEPLTKDNLNPDPWGDIVCKVCRFVIATVSGDREGELSLIYIGNL